MSGAWVRRAASPADRAAGAALSAVAEPGDGAAGGSPSALWLLLKGEVA